jgi:cation diffusion facilitator CzcD-associated flavoprotein CzcO
MPDIPGLGEYRGAFAHTALWDHDVALAGERFAVIGTAPRAPACPGHR